MRLSVICVTDALMPKEPLSHKLHVYMQEELEGEGEVIVGVGMHPDYSTSH